MKPVDILLALGVALSWGIGFVLTRFAIAEASTTVVIMLRFVLSALPCFFIPRPKNVPVPVLMALGGLFGVQFLAQTYGMKHGVPAGLTAVVVQSQVIFTTVLATIVLKEYPTRIQIFGMTLAFGGLLMICGTVGLDFSYLAFAVTLSAPLWFAVSNVLLRRIGEVDMLQLIVWAGVMATPMLMIMVLVTEGFPSAWASIEALSMQAILSIVILGFIGQLASYWAWGRLLGRYSTSHVVPFALLVPFVAAGSSSLIFGEEFGGMRLAGMCIVLAGLVVMMLLPNLLQRARRGTV